MPTDAGCTLCSAGIVIARVKRVHIMEPNDPILPCVVQHVRNMLRYTG